MGAWRLLTILAAAAAVAVAGCGESGSADPVTVQVNLPGATPTPKAAIAPKADENTLAFTDAPQEQTLAVPEGFHPVVWVRTGERVAMRTEPGGGQLVDEVGRRSQFGSPNVFGVAEQKNGWVGVTTPKLPNNQLGWMKLDPKRLASGASEYSVVVDLSDYRLTLFKGKEEVRSFSVSIGAPASPTPTGNFAVTDTFRGGLAADYGCCALALSATQPNLPSGWLGGNRIAIHGTTGTIGVAASHGCVRASDADVSKLIDVLPLGSPVTIRR
jgi:lipoprotein-anchoring transpeptidase ErfK/SrfK